MSFNPHSICFGLSEKLDQQSLAYFLQLLGRPAFADILSDRLSTDEISTLVHSLTLLLKTHLSEDEYHTLFLGEPSPHPANEE